MNNLPKVISWLGVKPATSGLQVKLHYQATHKLCNPNIKQRERHKGREGHRKQETDQLEWSAVRLNTMLIHVLGQIATNVTAQSATNIIISHDHLFPDFFVFLFRFLSLYFSLKTFSRLSSLCARLD